MRARILIIIFWMLSWVSASAQDTLTVMSYNIYHGEQSYQPGESNITEVARLINEVQPDFVALQEIDSLTGRSAGLNNGTPFSLVDSLAKLTDMTGYFGKAIDYDGGGYGEGLLSKTPLKSQKVLLPIPKGGERRAVLYLQAKTQTGQPFIVGGTHLCHQYTANRVAQVRAINKHFGDRKTPVMLAGDFNFTPADKPYVIIQTQWLDAARRAGNAEPTYSFEHPDKRIDFLFLSENADWKVLQVKTLRRKYSDHLPLVAKIVIYPEGKR